MSDETFGIIFGIAAMLLVLWFYLVVPAQMASRRNRSPFLWVLISLFGSPILAILLLFAMGGCPPNGPGR
ncbi:hypothetical protein [Paracoccus lutimaris]|jgi:hypothetical protein|uniref:Uncharacterized protein n=1 Tax=Paracoccus lutimaris TaxID=1490030 RepID=A0A368YI69_9RHOB|nr:hypothetical protein [Paracoccus lutimaris]RCW77874.1 hypothetical protein DFP89_1549 [Paracoccus lutimaris]